MEVLVFLFFFCQGFILGKVHLLDVPGTKVSMYDILGAGAARLCMRWVHLTNVDRHDAILHGLNFHDTRFEDKSSKKKKKKLRVSGGFSALSVEGERGRRANVWAVQ